jgi:signal transduction histidine kinase
MFATLRGRLLFSYIALIGVMLCSVATALLLLLLNNPLPSREIYQRLDNVARASLPALRMNRERIDEALGEIAASTGVRTMRLTAESVVLYDSAQALKAGEIVEQRSLQRTGGDGQRGTYRDPEGRLWLYAAFPASSEGGGREMIVFSAPRPTAPILTLFGENLLRPLLQAAGIGLILAIILAVVISSSTARPLRRAAAAAHGIAGGDYSQRVPVEGPSEVQELAAAFNGMAEQVQRTQQTQRDFLANVTHELKTPLTSIQGYAQAMVDGAAAEPGAAAGIIYDEAARLHRLVEDLLDLARIESGNTPLRREHVHLPGLLKSITEHLALRAGEHNVRLTASLEALPPITGDNDRLAQVFINLIDNAITHTPPGGAVRVNACRANGGVEVSVSDTGSGIPVDDLSRVFERFYQVDKSRARQDKRGTGLGLTISKEIVEAHGGKINVESIEGAGTTFTVWLHLPRSTDETVTRLKH